MALGGVWVFFDEYQARVCNEAFNHLLDEGDDVNAQGGRHGNALQAALFDEDVQVMKLLLGKEADGDVLYAASEFGMEWIVKELHND
ncbi:hypothetical protein F5883DRAFT_716745 [Diaporthe sp. PMI_573]|nr:hypothetical protein F5883DRAFT_716745 [Diaporthaceae sp. PMI_573]